MVKSRREIALAAGRKSADEARRRRHERYVQEIRESCIVHEQTASAMAEVLRDLGYTVTGPALLAR